VTSSEITGRLSQAGPENGIDPGEGERRAQQRAFWCPARVLGAVLSGYGQVWLREEGDAPLEER
jgi:hypothetical protein